MTSARLFELAYGGEGRFATSLGNWLVKQNYEVTLMGSSLASVRTRHITKSGPEGDERKSNSGFSKQQTKVKALYPSYPIYALSRLVMSLLWFIRILLLSMKYHISLIHAQDTGYAGLAAIASGKFLRVPVIISSHGIRHKSLESVIHGRLKKILLGIESNLDFFTVRRADIILAANHMIKEYFEKRTRKIVEFMPVPIRLKEFEFSTIKRESVRKEIGVDEGTKLVGFVGRFSNEKNLLALLASLTKVVHKDSSIKLLMVGTGPLESQLREYVSRRGIENYVIFLGVRYDIGRILASLDVFVLPSYTEGFSTALLEAMASGRPIICSDIPGNRQLVEHNKEAVLFNPYIIEELENAIHLLAGDASLRSKLGYNARIKASQYDEDCVFPKILEYYEKLARGKP